MTALPTIHPDGPSLAIGAQLLPIWTSSEHSARPEDGFCSQPCVNGTFVDELLEDLLLRLINRYILNGAENIPEFDECAPLDCHFRIVSHELEHTDKEFPCQALIRR